LGMPYDIKVFLKAGAAAQRRRILERSGAALLARFEDEWIPLENRYFSGLDIARQCDLVFHTA
ncbi:MAG: uridine kinase, partial [Bacillota bacterium]